MQEAKIAKLDRCYLCNKVDPGDGSVRYIQLLPVCTDCHPDLPSPEGDTKAEGDVDILDHDAGVDEWFYKPAEPYKDEEYEE